MYWIGSCLKDAIGDERKDMDHFDDLLLGGLQWLWFALGLLETGAGRFYMPAWPRKTSIPDLEAKLLHGFVRWVEPLMTLRDHYKGHWASNILTLAHCGITYADFDYAGGDLRQALLLAGAIKE